MRSRTLLHSGLPMTSSFSKSCPSCGQRYDADVLFCPQDGTPLTNLRGSVISNPEIDLYVGLELSGHIRIKHLIGIGSMGRVYRAFQAGIDRDVAVKIIHRELGGNADLVARFHREAKIASRLSHPNVISVLMTGSIPQKNDPRIGGEMYLVMEYLDGMSLLSALAAAGTGGVATALPLSRALHIMIQVCEAVGEAHAAGIVHRDIKPENVMMIRRGDDPDFVKVLDFGIARLDWADRSMATQAGLIFGTAKYISPEGAEGKPVTPAADVYSIATVLYQCLAGRTPFEAESPVQLLMQHANVEPPDLRSIPRASYVPEPIAAVIMRNLAKKPEDRAADARALGKELTAAVRESGLDPEDVFRGGTTAARRGATKMPSKERTKSLDLSPELAARIGGIASRTAESTPIPEPVSVPEPSESSPKAPTDPAPPGLSADAAPEVPPEPAAPAVVPDEPHALVSPAEPAAPEVKVESRETAPTPEPSESRASDADSAEDERNSSSPQRTRLPRIVAIALAVLAVPFFGMLEGKHLGWITTTSHESVDARVEAAREAMRRQAWDSPPNDNVKHILDDALGKWPTDTRVLNLRHEAAERLVTSALGRKYAGDMREALHLARLAVSLEPNLTAAQLLVVELENAATAQQPTGSVMPLVAPAPGQTRPTPEAKPSASAAGKPSAPMSSAKSSLRRPPSTLETPVLPPSPPPLPWDRGGARSSGGL